MLHYINRGIKTLRTIKTKLPHNFCLNGPTIMIGQLVLVKLANRKTGRRDLNKIIRYLINLFINIFLIYCSSPNCPMIIVRPFIQYLRDKLIVLILYIFIPLLIYPECNFTTSNKIRTLLWKTEIYRRL